MELEQLKSMNWYRELMREVRRAVEDYFESDSANLTQLENEREEIEKQKAGWRKTLSDPELFESIRNDIHSAWKEAEERQQQLTIEIEQRQSRENFLDEVLNPQSILTSLNRLDEVLAENNPTMANLELSLHIDRIDCFEDGRVVLRLCKLGALSDCVDILRTDDPLETESTETDGADQKKILPRRRSKLRVGTIGPEGRELDAIATFAADPARFAGVDDQWFEEHEFQLPESVWYKSHARDVVAERKKGKSYPKLARHFSKSKPTIKKALLFAIQQDPALEYLAQDIPWRIWHQKFADLVAVQADQGKSISEMSEYFDQSTQMIEKAIHYERSHLKSA